MNNIKKLMIVAGLFCLSNLQAMDWDAAFTVFKGNVKPKSMKHDDALDQLEAAGVSIDDNHAGDIVALYLANDLVLSKDKARLSTAKQAELEKALQTYNAAKAASVVKTAPVAVPTAAPTAAPAKAANPYIGPTRQATQALKDALKAIPAGNDKDECIAAVKQILTWDDVKIQGTGRRHHHENASQAGHNIGRLSGKKASKRIKA